MLSEEWLDAEVRAGELFKLIPKASGGDRKSDKFKNPANVPLDNNKKIKSDSTAPFEKTKEEIITDLGFTKKQAQRLETLADNKDLVEQVK